MKKTLFLPVVIVLVILASSFQIILKTSLEIKILNRLGNPVPETEVTLYENRDDYESEKNPVGVTTKTDTKGKVLFKELKAAAYFVSAKKGELSNYGDAEVTDTLTAGRRNKVVIIIN
jgi:uncharacterized GH25 family protein